MSSEAYRYAYPDIVFLPSTTSGTAVGLVRLDRAGHENDRAFYCEAWNGAGAYTYDRIGRGTLHIRAACLSVLGGMQPGPLERYLRAVFAGRGDDGLLQRFQLAVWPDGGGRWQNVDRWPNAEARARVKLLNQNPNGLLLFRDELSGFLHTMDRPGHENDRAFYCEAWNGAGAYTYDRIGRGTLHIRAACLSVLGGIQPGHPDEEGR